MYSLALPSYAAFAPASSMLLLYIDFAYICLQLTHIIVDYIIILTVYAIPHKFSLSESFSVEKQEVLYIEQINKSVALL